MIGSLCGKPIIIDTETLLIDVGGVGYRVIVPPRVLEKLDRQSPVRLWIYTHVRQEVLDLFGFVRLEELELFKILLTVSGIGPRTAILIMNHDVEAIREAVVTADIEFFSSIPRLGKKNAQRIIIELRPKLGQIGELDLKGEKASETQEIIDALCSIGFSKKEARQALVKIPREAKTVEEKVKAALKVLGKK